MAANDKSGKLPPFPEDVPTHPLLVIDYEKLKAGDLVEQVHPIFALFIWHATYLSSCN